MAAVAARPEKTNSRHIISAKERLRIDILTLLKTEGLILDRNQIIRLAPHNKEKIRAIHFCSRNDKLQKEGGFIAKWYSKVSEYFASGYEINPDKIQPHPILVENSDELAALFRIASLWWSVPVSRGFGRRFRILVVDRSNGKLMGLLGLTDPVFNLSTRDKWIGWDVRTKEKRLVHVMDAYVLGAVPPYNRLLGAKLIGMLAASDFIRNVFRERYHSVRSIISGRRFDGRLALVTATSALGRASIYNRLRLDNREVFYPVGFTEGYGHFHLANGTYEKLRQYLKAVGDPEVDRFKFGSGPNYRFRIVRRALEHLQLSPELLRHGVKRGVYVAPLASNSTAFLRGEAKRLRWHHRPLCSIIKYWRERWLVPRALRDISYRDFDSATWKVILGLTESAKQ